MQCGADEIIFILELVEREAQKVKKRKSEKKRQRQIDVKRARRMFCSIRSWENKAGARARVAGDRRRHPSRPPTMIGAANNEWRQCAAIDPRETQRRGHQRAHARQGARKDKALVYFLLAELRVGVLCASRLQRRRPPKQSTPIKTKSAIALSN
jgi:hypothetical protein